MSTLALQELILPSVANTTDSAVVASQERWKVITLEQPITGDLACKQRSWDDAVVRRTKKDLTEKLTNDIQLARFIGAQYVHAGDWLNALPIANCGLHLDDETMRIAIDIRLGTQIFTHVHVGPLVDTLGLHCFVYRRSTGKQTRHNLLNDVIWRSFSRAKIQATMLFLFVFF